MKTCSGCQTLNAATNKFCQQCGLRLDLAEPALVQTPEREEASTVQPAADAAEGTRLWKPGQEAVEAAPLNAPVALTDIFGTKDRLVIGRAPDCDVQLPHPLVSRYHALLERLPDGELRLRDLTSVNGVWISGMRIHEPTLVREGQRVGIGPFLFTLQDGLIRSIDNSRSLRLEAHDLTKTVSLGRRQTKTLLDRINLVVDPGEFVSILGPSGCGKSTLMDALNGRRRASGGRVLANGEDFYLHYDNFRTSLGYVPQRDIVHTGLTVYKALFYTARLRLPYDTDRSELKARVEEVLAEMELGPHRNTLVSNLSGGQIKRVSLGAELLAQPALLYIDEATSGLDAGTEGRMMKLFRALSDQGRSILCITHNIDNVDQCHLIIVLARGKLMYYGPPAEAPQHFRVRRLGDIYDCLRDEHMPEWEAKFLGSSYYRQYVLGRLKAEVQAPPAATRLRLPPTHSGGSTLVGAGVAALAGLGQPRSRPLLKSSVDPEAKKEPEAKEPVAAAPAPPPPPEQPAPRGLWGNPFAVVGLSKLPPLAESFRRLRGRALRLRGLLIPLFVAWRQFRVLTSRYLELILNDRRGLVFVLLQSPFVALLLIITFYNRPYRDKIMMPRPIKPEERRALLAMRELTNTISSKPDPNNPAADDKVQGTMYYKVNGETKERPLTRKNVREMFSEDRPPGIHLTPDQFRKVTGLPRGPNFHVEFQDADINYEDEGKPSTIKYSEMRKSMKEMQDEKLIDKLLEVKGPALPDKSVPNPRYTYILLFVLVMIVIWCGCNNAAKEIVKEEAVYARERAVNLGIVPYLSSKFLVQTAVTVFQAAALMGLVFGTQEVLARNWPDKFSTPLIPDHMLPYPSLFGVLVLLSMAGVSMGLLLSACVNTPDKANALLPYVLIPQMLLGGGFLPIGHGIMYWLAAIASPVYWAYRAVRPGVHHSYDPIARFFPLQGNSAFPCEALAVQTVVMLLLTAWFLRRKGN
jgi:ABC-type multidrug transport system ATPase subunit